ncbi:MAG TPA: hypothetical protein VNO35_27700 [Steroidobacteraceae bacterium]|nr:hypothetical protein [Steroidobacteraceae bacterium]
MLYTTAEPARVTGEDVRHLVFFSDLGISLNKVIQQKITSGDKVLLRGGRLGRAEFIHDGVEFAFEKLQEPPGSTELICRSANPLPAVFDRRVQEALRFMTFSQVSWSVSQRISNGSLTIALAATPSSPSGVLPSPIPEHEGQDFWRLFCCFLDHVCRHPETETHHRLTANLTLLLGLQKIQIETVALALGVATEGILNSEHPSLATPATKFLAVLAQLDKLASRIKCEYPKLKVRVQGAIRAMSERRPKDALLYLRERGIISKDQFKAWDELRNSAAHAAVIDEDNLQERITQCFKLYELILILTFLAVGYTGKYRQTSLPGWPIGVFEKTAADLAPIVSDSAKLE